MQPFKAGDVLKIKEGKGDPQTRVMFFRRSKKYDICFHGELIVAGAGCIYRPGYFSKTWALDLFELAESAKQAPEVKEPTLDTVKAVLVMLRDNIDTLDKDNIRTAAERLLNLLDTTAPASEVPELPEIAPLPERWAIKRTPENYKMVNSYFNTYTSGSFTYHEGYCHFPEVGVGYSVYDEVKPGYTEIDTATFKKHVLKQ